MGKAFAKLFGKKDMRILMLGLDAAGKTSILLTIESNGERRGGLAYISARVFSSPM